jgi:endonuclease/exonuclease/phosphatase (EEP) superfamily protein YafD
MKLKTILELFGCLTIILTVIPIVAADFWWVRVFDFPHIQITILSLISILTFLIKFSFTRKRDVAFIVVLVACFVFQLSKIIPYTSIAPFEAHNSTEGSDAPKFSIYLSNVLQSNKKKDKLVAAINKRDPDVLFLMETNQAWMEGIVEATQNRYPHRVEHPLPNNYGMLLYSKFPLVDAEIKRLVADSIPSIFTLMVLPSGDTVQLYCIHPTPPMPQHNPRSTDRDAQLMMTALQVYESKHPVVVMGDFNDVTWSQSTRTFKEAGQLLDPRRGRGLYNSFHTGYFFMRWPLDHFFISEHFRVANLKREPSIDSDHFPISIDLTLEPDKAAEQRADPPTESQLQYARKQIRKEERKNDKK